MPLVEIKETKTKTKVEALFACRRKFNQRWQPSARAGGWWQWWYGVSRMECEKS
jgi:hypothetical protein